jgi:hypothetical protein
MFDSAFETFLIFFGTFRGDLSFGKLRREDIASTESVLLAREGGEVERGTGGM